MPKVALPPVVPLTCQVTVVFVEFVTGAENCWELLTGRVTVLGEIAIVTGSVLEADEPPHPAHRIKKQKPTAASKIRVRVQLFRDTLSNCRREGEDSQQPFPRFRSMISLNSYLWCEGDGKNTGFFRKFCNSCG